MSRKSHTMVRQTLVTILLSALLVHTAHAQPTFGRPRPDKPAAPQPAPPEPDDQPDPPDDDPEAAPDEGFVPSPDSWLETDPPRKAPARDVEAGKTYAWRSADGLRYAYSIPITYKPDGNAGYDIVVICHPANADFRWGIGNHAFSASRTDEGAAAAAAPDPSRIFRPTCIVVSPDGPGGEARAPERRTFPATGAAAVRFRDFVLELTRTMPGRRVFLYGTGGGGAFVVSFAGLFPALCDGAVAYGCGLPEDFKIVKSSVPVVFVHGVKNGIVPFSAAVSELDAQKAAGNRMVRLRALRAFNDYPNPVRVSECIDYLVGVRTDDPAETLACVESILTPKPVDEYDYVAPVWYAGARELLGRILSEPGPLTGEAPFEDDHAPSDAVQARAREVIKLIDAEAARHVAALRESMPAGCRKAEDLYLDGGAWLGHLIAARDDFRGVKPMEDFAKSFGFDAALENHKAAAGRFMEQWSPSDEVGSFEAAVTWIPQCFLYEALPIELATRMKAWKRKAQGAEIDIDPEALEGCELVSNWDEGCRKGLEAYEKIWRRWRFEPAVQAKPGAKAADKGS